jgi:hypothetical protein
VRRGDGRGLLAVAVVAAVVTLGILVAAFVRDATGRHGPAAEVADRYLTALAEGDGTTAYQEVSPFFRSVVFRDELDLLADAVAEVVGGRIDLQIVGTERTSDTTVLTGYRADTDAGVMEGVVTVVEDQGRWWVQDASYRFPDAPDGTTDAIDAVVRMLNDQIVQRLSS